MRVSVKNGTSTSSMKHDDTSGKFFCEKGGAVHPDRILNTFVLLFGCEGEYRIKQNEMEYALVPGTYMLLLSGFNHHGTVPCVPGLSHYWCHFSIHDEYSLLDENETNSLVRSIQCKNDRISSNFTGVHRRSSLIYPNSVEYHHWRESGCYFIP